MNREVAMNHISILSDPEQGILEFSHFNYDAPAGIWKKENIIVRPCIKLNIFVEGSFSVFCDNALHQPILGDVCFLPPMKMHYGQIKKAMHVHYYQLDIGCNIFSDIPDGERLLARLIEKTEQKESFLRPDTANKEKILELCRQIEFAIQKNEKFLAYAKVIELLALLDSLYPVAAQTTGVSYSMRTAQTIQYIEDHFAENLSVAQISKELGISTSFLSRIFKREIGVPIHEYLNQYKILKSIEFLKNHSVTESAYLCGFCDTSHFISVFKKHMKITPMVYIIVT